MISFWLSKCGTGFLPLLSATHKGHAFPQAWMQTWFLTLPASGSWINRTHRSLPAELRFFSISDPRSLKHVETTTTANLNNDTATDSNDIHAISRRSSSGRRKTWSVDELDRILELVKQGMMPKEISLHFPDRPYMSTRVRVYRTRRELKLENIQYPTARRWSSSDNRFLVSLMKAGTSSIEIAKKFPERTLSSIRCQLSRIRLTGAEEMPSPQNSIFLSTTDKNDEAQLFKKYQKRNNLLRKVPSPYRRWTAAEIKLLEERYELYAASHDPNKRGFWSMVAGEAQGHEIKDDGREIEFQRSSSDCSIRWRQLQASSIKHCLWKPEETQRLIHAVQEERGMDIPVVADVLHKMSGPTAIRASTSTTYSAQEPDSIALTNDDSKFRPSMATWDKGWDRLNWKKIAEHVETKDYIQCRRRAAAVFRKVNLGPWSQDEKERFRKGLELFGTQWQAVARYIQTRSPAQTSYYWRSYQKRTITD